MYFPLFQSLRFSEKVIVLLSVVIAVGGYGYFIEVGRRISVDLKHQWTDLPFWLEDTWLTNFAVRQKTGTGSLMDEFWDLFVHGADNADVQWRLLEDRALLLIFAMLSIAAVTRVVAKRHPALHSKVLAVIGVIFVFAVHGADALVVLAFSVLTFGVSRLMLPSKPWEHWVLQLMLLGTAITVPRPVSSLLSAPLGVLGVPVLLPWEELWRFNTLRLLSFTADASTMRGGDNKDSDEVTPPELKVESHSSNDVTIDNFLAYLYLPALYTSGPIMTFSQFCTDLKRRSSLNKSVILAECRRVALLLTLVFLFRHLVHVSCILRTEPALLELHIEQLVILSYLNLTFVWLKLSCIWKCFRLVGLLAGFTPPDNVPFFFPDVGSVSQFWRDWHASFYQWLVKYIYLPLGGNKAPWFISAVASFGFVGIWHEVGPTFAVWAGMMIVLRQIESLFGASKTFNYATSSAPRRILTLAWMAISMLLMGLVNGVAFGLPVVMSSDVKKEIFSSRFVFTCALMFVWLVALARVIRFDRDAGGSAVALAVK